MDGWEGLPAVSYNTLANSLEEKILHMASACTVFGQQKMIKVRLKIVSCVAFCRWFLILGERKQGSRRLNKEEEDALSERQREVHFRKRLTWASDSCLGNLLPQ